MSDTLKNEFNVIKEELVQAIDAYFKQGRMEEIERKKNELKDSRKARKRSGLWQIASGFFEAMGVGDVDFDPSKPEIEFTSKSEAARFIDNIKLKIKNISDVFQNRFEEIVYANTEALEDNVLVPMRKHVEESLKAFADDLKKSDIKIKFYIPPLSSFRARNVDFEQFMDNVIDPGTRTETRRRRQSGLWGKICELFDTDDWGWEEYEREVTYYKVKLNNIRSGALSAIEELNSDMQGAVDAQIRKPLDENIKAFFADFTDKMESLKQDYKSAIHDKERRKADLDAIIENCSKVAKRLQDSKGEIDDFGRRAKELYQNAEAK